MAIEPQHVLEGDKISSSLICRLIVAGEFSHASALLGRPYCVEGEVRQGQGVGRQLGFPTLNIWYPDDVLVPQGVLAGWAEVRGVRYAAAVNSGRRPTIETDGHSVVEIHVLADDVPTDVVRVKFYPVRKIRDERVFSTREELVEQIKRDCAEIRAILAADAS